MSVRNIELTIVTPAAAGLCGRLVYFGPNLDHETTLVCTTLPSDVPG